MEKKQEKKKPNPMAESANKYKKNARMQALKNVMEVSDGL